VTGKHDNLKHRTKCLALDVIRFVRSLPSEDVARVLGKQLLRSATSAGANYRSACRARSRADMVSKLKLVEEELDESAYWLELLEESGYDSQEVPGLVAETEQLLAIIVSSIKTLRSGAFSGNSSLVTRNS